MAFKIALFAALCVAQAFAFQPSPVAYARNAVCRNPAEEIPHTFDEAVSGFDEVRETVSMAALDAYSKGSNIEIIIACFRAQKDSFIELGERFSGMIRDASQELAGELRDRADKYAKLLAVPLRTIAVTMRDLPEKVYSHLKLGEFVKAAEAVEEARSVVRENGKIIGDLMQKIAAEGPELADKAEEMALNIRNETKKGSEAIRQAFGKCVMEGGPGSYF